MKKLEKIIISKFIQSILTTCKFNHIYIYHIYVFKGLSAHFSILKIIKKNILVILCELIKIIVFVKENKFGGIEKYKKYIFLSSTQQNAQPTLYH